jgi:pyroglutamyl-peptidase
VKRVVASRESVIVRHRVGAKRRPTTGSSGRSGKRRSAFDPQLATLEYWMPASAGMTEKGFDRLKEKIRILITGFGPFPGAPFNPTMPLVKRLTQLRRPALGDVELIGHIFHVTYSTVDRELPALIAEHRPQGLLMFGLADRTAHVRIETRARNAITTLFPDADRTRARKRSISGGVDALMFGPHTAKLLRAAVGTGIDARASRDAGSYLCNYLSWRAIEATGGDNGPRLAAFVHIPLLARGEVSQRRGTAHRITMEGLVDAGEAILLEMVRLTRAAARAV